MAHRLSKALFFGTFAATLTALAACGPAAEATATTSTQPTATTRAVSTATTAPQATSTTAGTQATATSRPAGTTGPVATATVGAKDKGSVQPVPVLKSPGPNPAAQKGGVLRRLTTTYPPNWVAWEGTNAATTDYTGPLHDTLFDWDAFTGKDPDVLLGNLVYDWWLSQDGQTWTFKLTEAKFHDGSPVTCGDAKFAIDAGRTGRDSKGSELRAAPRAIWLKRVTTIRCTDDFTMQIDTDGPLPSLPSALAFQNFSPYPRKVFEGNLPLMISQPGPGMGPFEIDQAIVGEKVLYKRFANYWNKPYPLLDRVEVINSGSATAVYAAFRVGRAELGTVPTGNLKAEMDRKFFTFQQGSNHQATFMDVNALRQPWGDPRVRMALRCTVDSVEWVSTVSNGFGKSWAGIFPLDSKWVLPEAKTAAIHPCLDPKTTIAQRREIAQGLMRQLGYGPDNKVKADLLIRGTAEYQPLISYFDSIYIAATPRILQNDPAYKAAYAGEFDIHPSGKVTPRQDADHWFYENFYSTSDRNYGKWKNPEVDVLIDQQSKTVDPAKRLELVHKIQEIMLKETAAVMVQHSGSVQPSAPWLKDFYITSVSIGGTHYKFTRVWIDQAELKAKGG